MFANFAFVGYLSDLLFKEDDRRFEFISYDFQLDICVFYVIVAIELVFQILFELLVFNEIKRNLIDFLLAVRVISKLQDMFNALFLSDQFTDEVSSLCHPLVSILTDRNKRNCITISLFC